MYAGHVEHCQLRQRGTTIVLAAVLWMSWILLPNAVWAQQNSTTMLNDTGEEPPPDEMTYPQKVDPFTVTDRMDIDVSFTVHSVGDIDLLKQTFTVDATLDLIWFWPNDTVKSIISTLRAVLPIATLDENGINSEPYSIPPKDIHRFWNPDPFFVDAASVHMPSLDVPTQNLYWDNRDQSASMAFRTRQRMVVSCNLDFSMYPVDFQLCNLRIRPTTYLDGQMVLHWETNDEDEIALYYEGSEYLMASFIDVRTCEYQLESTVEQYSGVCIQFKHTRMFHCIFLSTVMPVCLLVVASFCPSFMSIHSTADRVNVSVVLLQALFTIFAQARLVVPPISYMTYMDILIIGSIITIVATLLQSIIVRVLLVREDRHNIRTLHANRKRRQDRLTKDIVRYNLISYRKAHGGLPVSRGQWRPSSHTQSPAFVNDEARSGLVNGLWKLANETAPLSPVKFNYYAGRIVLVAYILFQTFFWIVVTYNVSRKSERLDDLVE